MSGGKTVLSMSGCVKRMTWFIWPMGRNGRQNDVASAGNWLSAVEREFGPILAKAYGQDEYIINRKYINKIQEL